MSLLTNRPTVGVTAAALWTRSAYGPKDKIRVTVHNPNATAILIGSPSVSSSSYGYSLASGTLANLELDGGDVLWACTASGTSQVNVLVSGY